MISPESALRVLRQAARAVLMRRWLLRVFTIGVALPACTSPSAEELLEGKACSTLDRRCAAGYTCNEDDICVPKGSLATGSAGGGGGSGATGYRGAAGTQSTGGHAGAGALQSTGGDAGSGAVATGGVAGSGAAPSTGGDAGSGAVATGGAAGTGGASGGGTGATGGGILCAGPAEDCTALEAALRHRYRFDEGPGAVDSVGAADGTLERNATLTGDGAVALSAGLAGGGYVDLPNGIVSALSNATFEAWVDWDGAGSAWQRIFDFGEAMYVVGTSCVAGGPSAPEGSTGVCGRTYLTLCANTDVFPTAAPRVGFLVQPGTPTNDALRLDSSTSLPANSAQHLAVVVNDSANRLALYRNGAPDGSLTFTHSLSEIQDINNWLGRSQFTGDPTFEGQILEFRIYDEALTDSQIATSFAEGPDPLFLE